MAKKLPDFPARFAVSGTAALALILGDKQLLFAALCVRVVRDGQHQADAVFLVHARGAWVIVDGRDVGRGVQGAYFVDHALAADVVRQAAKALGAHNVFKAGMHQLYHFGC